MAAHQGRRGGCHEPRARIVLEIACGRNGPDGAVSQQTDAQIVYFLGGAVVTGNLKDKGGLGVVQIRAKIPVKHIRGKRRVSMGAPADHAIALFPLIQHVVIVHRADIAAVRGILVNTVGAHAGGNRVFRPNRLHQRDAGGFRIQIFRGKQHFFAPVDVRLRGVSDSFRNNGLQAGHP